MRKCALVFKKQLRIMMSDVSVEFDRDDGKSDMACIQECWIVWHGLLK